MHHRTNYDIFKYIERNEMDEKDYFNQLLNGMNDPYMQYKRSCNFDKTY